MTDIAYYSSPIGRLILAGQGDALVGVWLEGQNYCFGSLRDEMRENPDTPVLRRTADWMDRYFCGDRPPVEGLELLPSGTEFQRSVWSILRTIPYGQTVSYGEVAKKVAASRGIARMSARAVGSAVGHNPILILIPCHRVVGADGSLTGFAGGIDAKIRLLTHEGIAVGRLPRKRTE